MMRYLMMTTATQTKSNGRIVLKKSGKKIIKRAKKHPEWYSQEDVMYAKIMKKVLKKSEQRKTDQCDT